MDPARLDLLTRLVDAHGAALVLYARQWCDDPEDAVQEALVRLMRTGEPPRQPVAWAYRVVRNEAASQRRGQVRRRRRDTAAAQQAAPWFTPTAGAALDARAVAELLPRLPDDQREAVVLRVWGGLSYQEIADVTGASTSTAHRRYEAGLGRLREWLGVASPSAALDPTKGKP